ncbi:MipA/OmpV family protein [Thalassotalea sp. PLHSN55]|uniref:MipA/OmpV family protein n=1 Tax=Thalassotalea sp. PLHSN55 TaxID=3435888 RepID=UPI003F83F8F6
MKIQGCIAFFIFVLLSFSAKSENSERIFEYGIGTFAFSLPEYAGAKDTKNYIVPLPYFYYQDKTNKVDREGLISSLWQVENWYLDFSASAQIPVNSDDIDIRTDMPDIDWTFQAGPALKYYFYGKPRDDDKTFVSFYTRKAITTDFSYLDDAGWQYGLIVSSQRAFSNWFGGKLKWQNRASVNFASTKFHQLYYDVEKAYSTEERSEFKSSSGYHSSTLSSGLTYRKGRLWLAGFVLYRNMSGTKNEASALIQKRENFSAGLGVAWIINQ